MQFHVYFLLFRSLCSVYSLSYSLRRNKSRGLQVRYKYRSAELAAYVVGTLLTVLIVLVWPALMLLAGIFNCSAFTVWAMLAVVLAVIAALYLGLLPPLAVIIQVRYILCALEEEEEVEEEV